MIKQADIVTFLLLLLYIVKAATVIDHSAASHQRCQRQRDNRQYDPLRGGFCAELLLGSRTNHMEKVMVMSTVQQEKSSLLELGIHPSRQTQAFDASFTERGSVEFSRLQRGTS